jgi:hypothetical protein
MFEVIGSTPQYLWGEYFRSIVNFSQQIIRFSYNKNNLITLMTSVLAACDSLLHADGGNTAVTSSLPLLAEMTSSVLSGLSNSNINNELKKTAIILFISCARINSVYKDTAYQQGFKFIRDMQVMNGDISTEIQGNAYYEDEVDGEYGVLRRKDISSVVEIIYALKNTIISKPGLKAGPGLDPGSIEYLKNLSQHLSRSCMNINKNGKFHEVLNNSKFGIENGEYLFIVPCSELNSLNKVLFELFREEVLSCGLEGSECLRFFQIIFEDCIQSENNISGLFGPFGEKGGPAVTPGGTSIGDVSVGNTVHTSDKSITNVIGVTDEQYYTSFRLLDLIGAYFFIFFVFIAFILMFCSSFVLMHSWLVRMEDSIYRPFVVILPN